MKKILFVAHSPTLAGGGERSLLDMIIATKKHGKYDIHVSVPGDGALSRALSDNRISYSFATQSFSTTQSRVNISRWEGIANADSLIAAREVVEKIDPSLVVINTSVIAWFGHIAVLYGIPVITIVRELHGGKNEFNFLPSDALYMKNLQGYASYIAFNSEHTRETYKDSLDITDSFIVNPVVTIDKSYIETAASKPVFASPADPVSVFIIGNIAPHKNQLDAVKALNIIKQRDYTLNIHLNIMGPVFKDAYLNKIKTFISENKLQDSVSFIPFSDDPFPEFLKNDIVIMASHHEAFGRVTVESQLLQRVTIGAASAGTLEIIDDMSTGILYNPGSHEDLANKILWAIENKKQSQKIAINGRKSAISKYSADTAYKQFFIHIDKLLKLEVAKDMSAKESLYYEPLYALIERNLYMNEKLKEYAAHLENAIVEINKKQAVIDSGIKARTMRTVKSMVKRGSRT